MILRGEERRILIHIIAWIVFISYEVTVAKQMGSPSPLWEFAVFYLLSISLFYFNSHVIFPYSFNRRKTFFILPVAVLLQLAVYTLLSIALSDTVEKTKHPLHPQPISYMDWISSIWRGVYFVGLSTAYWLFMRALAETKKANESKVLQLLAERATVKAQNAYLKAQINPHMLFNTLNFIYNSVESVSAKASEGILLLSDIMRYALNEVGDDGKIELWKEAAQINRYISLNQLRFSNRLCITVATDISEHLPFRLPPLLLLTFIENVFKHGDLTNPLRPAVISLNCKDNMLLLHTENLKNKKRISDSGHIGIINARTRLNNYYHEGDFTLSLQDNGDTFLLDLKIRL